MSSLNEKQHEVSIQTDHVVVCAPPGSGKTHTSINLVENLLKSPANSVMMLTFTSAGAEEMCERIEKRLSKEDCKRVKAKTFHSLMLTLYKRLPNRRQLIIGADYHMVANSAINNAIPEILADCGSVVAEQVSENREEAKRCIDVLGRTYDIPDDAEAQHVIIYRHYLKVCQQLGKTDLNEVSKRVVKALEDGTFGLLNFSHLIIDEYQDTDEIQWRFAKVHGEGGAKIQTIGDDDQSIYSFRAALGFTGMKLLQDTFDAKAIVLEECYRCHAEILNSARSLIECNQRRVPKEMKAFRGAGGAVAKVDCDDATLEALGITHQIKKASGTFAILTRNRKQLDIIETEIQANGIEYTRMDGKSPFEDPDVKGILMIFAHVIDNRYQNASLILVFLEECSEAISALNRVMKSQRNGFLSLSQCPEENISNKTQQMLKHWSRFCSDTDDIEQIQRRVAFVCEVITEAKALNASSGRAEKKLKSTLQWIEKMFIRWAEDEGWLGACQICSDILRGREQDKKSQSVILGTMHGSKGLEFDNVWLAGVNNSVMPGNEDLTLDIVEEERRLLYVGITRAINNLWISFHGENKKSVFLDEIREPSIKNFKVTDNGSLEIVDETKA